MQKHQRAHPTRFRGSPPPQPRQSTRTQPALPLQTQPQDRVPPLAHAYFYRAPQGGRTFSNRLRMLAPLNSASHVGCSPPIALKRPCSHADPNRLRPLDTPGASAAATLLGWQDQMSILQWAYARRFCGAEPPPPHHSAGGRQPDLSQNPPQRQVAPGGNPPKGPPPGEAGADGLQTSVRGLAQVLHVFSCGRRVAGMAQCA